jgi:hypothetical protein
MKTWAILISISFLLFPVLSKAQVHPPVELNGNQAGFGISAGDPFDVETGMYYRPALTYPSTTAFRFASNARSGIKIRDRAPSGAVQARRTTCSSSEM